MVLVLASGDTPFYDQARRVWQLYSDRHPEIKVFMVYGHPFPKDAGALRPDSDLYYPDIPAHPEIPASTVPPRVHRAMIQKTVRAMRFLDERYTYDWFLRTNISTFWNWFELLAHVAELPPRDCYSGDGPFLDEYLSGYDTIVNGYMVGEFLTHAERVLIDDGLHEDHAMGRVFHTIMGAPFLPSRIHVMERFRTTSTREDIRRSIREGMARRADHYRVKNIDEGFRRRREIEEPIYRELLLEIYGITDSFAITMTEEHLREQAAQRALQEEKARAIADWIAGHGTPEQRARHATGALPMDEAIQAMIDDVFAPLSDHRQYEQYVREGGNGSPPRFVSTLAAEAALTIGRGEIVVTSAHVTRLTASQLAVVQQFERLMPEATVVLRTHTLAWRRMPDLALPASFGILVTQRVGPFTFGREYATAG